MTSLEDTSDEEYLDDPIILIDFEHQINYRNIEDATNVECYTNTSGKKPERIEAQIDLTDSDVDVVTESENQRSSSFRKTYTTLPVTFFDIPDNVKLLNECRPLRIDIVDCDKHAWYYKKHIRSVEVKSDTIVTDGAIDLNSVESTEGESNKHQNRKGLTTPTTEMYLLNRSPGNKPKIRPVNISLYMGHNKSCNIKPSVHSEKETEVTKNRDVEKEKVNDKDLKQVDFRKNQGLIGLKITHVTPLEFDEAYAKCKDQKSETKCVDSIDANEKKSNMECSNVKDKQNLTIMNKQLLGKKNQNSCLNLALKMEKTPKLCKNTKIKENNSIVKEKADPLRLKVIDRLSFEKQECFSQNITSESKQNLITVNRSSQKVKEDQYIKNMPSVDSVHGKKKNPHKNLAKHWKETMRMFTKTKQTLLKPINANIRKKKTNTKTVESKTKNINEGEKVNDLSVYPINKNDNNNKKNNIFTKLQKVTSNTSAKVYSQNNPKYRDMPTLDQIEEKTSNDKLRVDRQFCEVSQNVMKEKSVIDQKSENSSKEYLANGKGLQTENKNTKSKIDTNIKNKNLSSSNNQLNPTMQTSFFGINDNVSVGNKQSNPSLFGTNNAATTNLTKKIHHDEHNSTKKNPLVQKQTPKNNQNIKKKTNMKTMNDICDNKNPQHLSVKTGVSKSKVAQISENQDCHNLPIGLPEISCVPDVITSNSDKQCIPSSDAEEKSNNANVIVYPRALNAISSHANGLYYQNQDNNNFRHQKSCTFASTMKTDSGQKLDANSIKNNNMISAPSYMSNYEIELNNDFINQHAMMSNAGSHINIPNHQSNEHAMMINTDSQLPKERIQPSTSLINQQAMIFNAGSNNKIVNNQSNVNATNKHAIPLNTNSQVSIGHIQPNKKFNQHAMMSNVVSCAVVANNQSNVNATYKHAIPVNTSSQVSMGYIQPNTSLINQHVMISNTDSHNNQSNVNATYNHAMMFNTGSQVSMGYIQPNTSLINQHAMMSNADSHNNQSNVNATNNHAMTFNTSLQVPMGYTQPNKISINQHAVMSNAKSSINQHAVMSNADSHTNLSNVNATNKHAMMVNSSLVPMGYNEPNTNLINQQAMMSNANSDINMGMNQSNVSSVDKYAMMFNTGSHMNIGHRISPMDKLAITLNTLNCSMQNQATNYYQMERRPIETVTSNRVKNNVRPTRKNSLKAIRPLNQAMRKQHFPQNLNGYVVCRPLYDNLSYNNNMSNLPTDGLNFSSIYNTNNAHQVWKPLYPLPYDLPPPQGFTGQMVQPHSAPTIAEGSTIIGRNDNGLIRTINIPAVPKLAKSIPANEVETKSNNINYKSDFPTSVINSKLEMLEELTKELVNVPDVEHSDTQNITNNRTPMPKAEAHPNLTKLLLTENKMNHSHFLQTIIPNIISRSKPSSGPLSRKPKVGATSAPKFESFQNNAVDKTGYSPPILPIPTYQKTLEILTEMNMYPNVPMHPSKIKNPAEVSYLAKTDRTSTKLCKIPVKRNVDNRKRTLPESDGKQEIIKKKPIEEYKKRTFSDEYKKKISLEEYKGRVSTQGNPVERDLTICDEKMENNFKCSTNKLFKESDIKQNSDLDQGYDSDSTVKL